jgi:hypothetical protein
MPESKNKSLMKKLFGEAPKKKRTVISVSLEKREDPKKKRKKRGRIKETVVIHPVVEDPLL